MFIYIHVIYYPFTNRNENIHNKTQTIDFRKFK